MNVWTVVWVVIPLTAIAAGVLKRWLGFKERQLEFCEPRSRREGRPIRRQDRKAGTARGGAGADSAPTARPTSPTRSTGCATSR